MSIRKVYPEKFTIKVLSPNKKSFQKSSSKAITVFTSPQYSNSASKPRLAVTPIGDLTNKFSEMQEKLYKVREDLLKEIKDTLDQPKPNLPEKIFHKTSNFVQRKQQIKENVKNHKCKSSAKLEKIKSIIVRSEDLIGKEFLSTEDVANGEAIDFLNINKREFGETQRELLVFKDKKRKTTIGKHSSEKLIKLNGRNSSLPELGSPAKTSKMKKKNPIITQRKSLDRNISGPVSQYILKEMKKLWPPDSQAINEKKRKILQVKINKLQSIIEEKSNPLIEEEIIGGRISGDHKFKIDTMIHQHLRSLRKKITIDTT